MKILWMVCAICELIFMAPFFALALIFMAPFFALGFVFELMRGAFLAGSEAAENFLTWPGIARWHVEVNEP